MENVETGSKGRAKNFNTQKQQENDGGSSGQAQEFANRLAGAVSGSQRKSGNANADGDYGGQGGAGRAGQGYLNAMPAPGGDTDVSMQFQTQMDNDTQDNMLYRQEAVDVPQDEQDDQLISNRLNIRQGGSARRSGSIKNGYNAVDGDDF